ncbi:hypothetical protein BC834DRAFT_818334 [Gloeopeniophorella convolvens]|nr:hypothetical protein BC834DRAFT_818334 [Gloeopeniophorella convolvens]
MRFATSVLLASVVASVSAHFQLGYPAPRGPFVEDSEPNFCDDYVHAVSNRSEFPLSGGFVTLTSEHTNWNLAVLISTVQDPTSFDNFSTPSGQNQLARNFATATGEGEFCIPLDLSNTGISSVKDGANVTIQLLFNGGDGALYQCADLTLLSSFQIPSNISCSNGTTSSSSSSSGAPSPTNSGSQPSQSGNGAASGRLAATGILGALGFAVASAFAL